MKTSQAGSTFPNLCGESTSAMSSAADEGEEAEEEEELDDGGEDTNGGSILSQMSAAATWSESKTATRSSGPISLPAGYIIPRAWLRLEALPLSSCGALGRLETYLTDEAEAEEEAPSDFASPATQAALAGSLPSSSSHTVLLILLVFDFAPPPPPPRLGRGAACAAQTVSATISSGSV